MNTDTAPKPVSKSALHRRRSSSGDRLNSASVTTDLDATTSLSLSFSNLGDFDPQNHLVTKAKANGNDEKEHVTHKTHVNTNNKHSESSAEAGGSDTPDADNDDSDGNSTAQPLNLTFPDLLTASPAPQEGPFPMTKGQKQLTKGGG